MEKRNPEEITKHATFEKLFPIREDLLKKIQEDMADRSFDNSQPVILATWKEQKEPVCIDGHTRIQAAINTGIEEIPVFVHELDTEEEALQIAIKLQRNRRNMTDAEITACIEALDRRRSAGRPRKKLAQGCANSESAAQPGKSSKEVADLMNVSSRKVEQVRTVLDHAEPEVVEAVKEGEMSVNRAYQETQKKRKASATGGNDKTQADESEESSQQVAPQSEMESGATDSSYQGELTVKDYSVRLSKEHYEALSELRGSIEEHLAAAVEAYLESLDREDDDRYGLRAFEEFEKLQQCREPDIGADDEDEEAAAASGK